MSLLDQPPARKPTKLTPSMVALICAALRTSNNATLATQHARIARRTYTDWCTRGRAQLAEYLDAHADVDPGQVTLDDAPFEELPYLHFLLATEKAKADFELENLALIGQAAAGVPEKTTTTSTKIDREGNTIETTTVTVERVTRHWQAGAWLLERTNPSDYGLRNRVEVTGEGGGPVQIDASPGLRLAAELAEQAKRRELGEAVIEHELGPASSNGDDGADQ
jgi:hypothetical protein